MTKTKLTEGIVLDLRETFYIVRTFETVTYFQVEALNQEEAVELCQNNDPLMQELVKEDGFLGPLIEGEKNVFKWELRDGQVLDEADEILGEE